MNQSAREFHERETSQMKALSLLRRGPLTKLEFERSGKDGSRLAPTIDVLRNGYGFVIDGDGSQASPYVMAFPHQSPTRVKTLDEYKDAYYASEHWMSVRAQRIEYDGYRCVVNGSESELHVHHFVYHLFAEKLDDLITVCSDCHEVIHQDSRLKFPSGMTVDHVRRLGFEPAFEPWLLPSTPSPEPEAFTSDSRGQLELFPE